MQISVLIADDHAVVREGLRILISAEPDLKIAGEADNGRKAVALASELKPDIVLMDLAMPECNGVKAAQAIIQQSPESKILVLSAYQDDDSVRTMLRCGAAGYLTKHTASQDLVRAIREVTCGHRFLSPPIAKRLNQQAQFSFVNGPATRKPAELTARETQVVKLVASGLANKQIASELGISIKTVEKHRQSAMLKLSLHDTAGLTRYAISKGWVALPNQLALGQAVQRL